MVPWDCQDLWSKQWSTKVNWGHQGKICSTGTVISTGKPFKVSILWKMQGKKC